MMYGVHVTYSWATMRFNAFTKHKKGHLQNFSKNVSERNHQMISWLLWALCITGIGWNPIDDGYSQKPCLLKNRTDTQRRKTEECINNHVCLTISTPIFQPPFLHFIDNIRND